MTVAELREHLADLDPNSVVLVETDDTTGHMGLRVDPPIHSVAHVIQASADTAKIMVEEIL